MEGRLILSRLDLQSDISFLVDTGADQSMLHPLDGVRMGIDYTKLTDQDESIGVGGICRNFVEPALLVFSEPTKRLYVYSIRIAVCPPSPNIMNIPSLLGRDVIDRWHMSYAPAKGRLTFRVLGADVTIPL